jgi:hypothetical protein
MPHGRSRHCHRPGYCVRRRLLWRGLRWELRIRVRGRARVWPRGRRCNRAGSGQRKLRLLRPSQWWHRYLLIQLRLRRHHRLVDMHMRVRLRMGHMMEINRASSNCTAAAAVPAMIAIIANASTPASVSNAI